MARWMDCRCTLRRLVARSLQLGVCALMSGSGISPLNQAITVDLAVAETSRCKEHHLFGLSPDVSDLSRGRFEL